MKKIVHICMAQYSDGWTYQENLLAKYHKKAGYDVTVLTSVLCYKEGKLVEDDKEEFVDINGVKVIRLPKKSKGLLGKVPSYEGFFEALEDISPDVIFSHGCQYRDTVNVIKYIKKNKNVELYVDNHADFTNSARSFISLHVLHKIIWKYYAKKLVKYTNVFWGVLPARVDFLTDVYGLPKDKCKLLVMGADDEFVEKTKGVIARKTQKRIRLGVPALFRYLKTHGYDIWVYSSNYYSIDTIQLMFRRYSVHVDGIICGNGKKGLYDSNKPSSINELIANKYKTTVHIDTDSIVITKGKESQFEEFEIRDADELWSKDLIQVFERIDNNDDQ